MNTELILIPTTEERIEVNIPLGIDSDLYDKIAPFMVQSSSTAPKVAKDAIQSIVALIVIAPEDFDWKKAHVGDVWRLMAKYIKPMLEVFQPETNEPVSGSGVPVSRNTKRGDRRKPLPRPNRKKLSGTQNNQSPM